MTLLLVALVPTAALVGVVVLLVVLARREARRLVDRITVLRSGATFVVAGVHENDAATVRSLILLHCRRRGLPVPALGAGGVPLRREDGAAVWPFVFPAQDARP